MKCSIALFPPWNELKHPNVIRVVFFFFQCYFFPLDVLKGRLLFAPQNKRQLEFQGWLVQSEDFHIQTEPMTKWQAPTERVALCVSRRHSCHSFLQQFITNGGPSWMAAAVCYSTVTITQLISFHTARSRRSTARHCHHNPPNIIIKSSWLCGWLSVGSGSCSGCIGRSTMHCLEDPSILFSTTLELAGDGWNLRGCLKRTLGDALACEHWAWSITNA